MKELFKNEETVVSIKGEMLADINDVLDFLCVGGEIEFGVVYELTEGFVVFELDEKDGDISYVVVKLNIDDTDTSKVKG